MEQDSHGFGYWRSSADQSVERKIDGLHAQLEDLSRVSPRLCTHLVPRDRMVEAWTAARGCETAAAGVPYVIQDVFDLAGSPTGCGTTRVDMFEAPMDASSGLVRRLTSLGLWCAGKTATPPFGCGLSGRLAGDLTVPHPSLRTRLYAGNSAASARIVRQGLTPLAFGLDSVGGMRVSAAFSGLFGFRFGPDDLARDGVLPLAPSMDAWGLLASRAGTMAEAIRVLCGIEPAANDESADGLRGLFLDGLYGPVDADVKRGILWLCRALQADEDPETCIRLRDDLNDAPAACALLQSREMNAVHRFWIDDFPDAYGEALLQEIRAGGRHTLTEVEASCARQLDIRESLIRLFESYDYLALAVAPVSTPDAGAWNHTLEKQIAALSAPATIGLLPVLTLPIHLGDDRSCGLQLILGPGRIRRVPELLTRLEGFYAAPLPAL